MTGTRVEGLGRHAPRNLAVRVDQQFIQHALNRVLGVYRTSITHVIVLEWSLHNRDPRALALLVTRNDTRISLELRILGAERESFYLPSVRSGTRKLSNVTTVLISSGYCLAKYIEMSPPIECPTNVTFL